MSRKEIYRRRVTKPIQTVDERFEGLVFDNLVEPGFKVEISTAFSKVLKQYARIFNPEGVASRCMRLMLSAF